MLPPTVTKATAQDRQRVIGAIVLAFVRDPIVRWVWPEPHEYLSHFPPFVEAFGGKAFGHDTAHHADEFSGAALWLPPGVQPDEEAVVGLSRTGTFR